VKIATGLVGVRGGLRADVIAGVTVAAYLVPQAMAYAQLAGLPPVTGLWAVLAVFFTLPTAVEAFHAAKVNDQ
jgi:sulfate permease, SulP family